MHVLNQDAYSIKRFLYLNKGIVIKFDKNGIEDKLNIKRCIVHKCLKTLLSKEYVTKIGNWQHAWYYVTEEGDKKLREEVGLPNEGREEEQQEIKN